MSKDEKPCGCEDRERCCCLRFREVWTAGSIYQPGDAVPYQGSSYVAIHANQNDPPPSPNWATIAGKGDAGPAGAAGQPGAAGLSGSSDAYVASSADITVNPQGVDIVTLALPPGSYVVTGTVNLYNADSDMQNWTLTLSQDGNPVLTINGSQAGHGGGLTVQDYHTFGTVVPVLATVTAAAQTTLTLQMSGYNISVDASLVALKVGTIHTS